MLSPSSGRHSHRYPASVAEDIQQRAGPGHQAGVCRYRETAEEGVSRGRWGFLFFIAMFTIQHSKNFIQKLLCNVLSAHIEENVSFSLAFKYPFTLSTLSLSNTVPAAPAPAKLFDTLQDSQLFDAEASEPLSSSGRDCSSSQDWLRNNRNSEVKALPASSRRWQSNGATQRRKTRGREAAVLYGVISG